MLTASWLTRFGARRPMPWLTAGLLLLALLSFLPDFREAVVPGHDARQYHSALHVLYAGLRHDGAIPEWLPYGRYGNPAFLLTMYVTPVGYAVALAGKVLSVGQSLALFKVMVLGEFLLFCVGSIRLSALLFRHPASIALVNIGAVLSFSWLASLDSNFHTYYLLPYILRSLVLFLREGRVTNLLLSGGFCLLSAVGNVPYYAPLLGLMLVVFAVAFLWARAPGLPRPKFVPWDAALLCGLVLGASLLAAAYLVNLRGLTGFTQGRDPVTRKVDPKVFVRYGGVTKPDVLALAFLTGAHTHGDNTYYVGLATLALAGLGLVRGRGPELVALGCLELFLLLFSMGHFVTAAAYYFPGMAYYRHVALIFGPAKYLLLLLAGFGLDHLLRPTPAGPDATPPWKRRWNLGLGLCLAALAAAELLRGFTDTDSPPWEYELFPKGLHCLTSSEALWTALSRLAVYGTVLAAAAAVARRREPGRRGALWAGALLTAFFVDLASFKLEQYRNWPDLPAEQRDAARAAFAVNPLPYRPVRVPPGVAEQQSASLQFLAKYSPIVSSYVHLYSVAGVDPSIPAYRTDFLVDGVAALFAARDVRFRQFPVEQLFWRDDRWLYRALGVEAPKLRLFEGREAGALPAGTARATVNLLPLDADALVLAAAPGDAPELVRPAAGEISVRDFGFDRLSADATVTGSGPAWLYYADADHPGWKATVDGEPAPIVRANLAFKAVRLGPGTHRVEFRFRNGPGSWLQYGLFAGSLAFILAMAAGLLRRGCDGGTPAGETTS